jgi:TIR domain
MPSDDVPDDFTVAISYAYNDNRSPDPRKRWLDRLLDRLHPLPLQDKVILSDIQLEAREIWDKSTRNWLMDAKVVVLLVSPAFLASKYIRSSELPALLMHVMNQGRTVIPIILHPCSYAETKFEYLDPEGVPVESSLSVFQSVNPPSEPLSLMEPDERNSLLDHVAQRILMLAPPLTDSKTESGSMPDSTMVNQRSANSVKLAVGSSLADALIVWDPEVIDHTDYVTLITALGDLVRSQGGIGVERIGHLGMGIPVSEDILA